MIDLHMHTTWSDGELIPAELVQRARTKGVSIMAITDHADHSNLETVVPAIAKFAKAMEKLSDMLILPGVELTHVPPAGIKSLTQKARRLGAKWVVVHGETPVEPVPPGTNLAAVKAGVDLLAHPGILSEEVAGLAAQKGVALEISARKGHCLGNGRVAKLGRAAGATLVLNTDAHAPGDLIDVDFAKTVALGAGLSEREFKTMLATSRKLAEKAMEKRSGGRKR